MAPTPPFSARRRGLGRRHLNIGPLPAMLLLQQGRASVLLTHLHLTLLLRAPIGITGSRAKPAIGTPETAMPLSTMRFSTSASAELERTYTHKVNTDHSGEGIRHPYQFRSPRASLRRPEVSALAIRHQPIGEWGGYTGSLPGM